MYRVGDLVTVLNDVFAYYVRLYTYEQWQKNPYGIVVAVEPLDDSNVILVKVHFQSLGNSYWLRASEVEPVLPPNLGDK
jgi:hypothetical protein